MLTRRHMQAIAQIVGEQRLRRVEHDRLVLDIARYLESENPRFSMSRFVQAADSAYGAAVAAPCGAGTQPEYNVCLDEQYGYGEPSAVFAAELLLVGLRRTLNAVLDIAEDGAICPSCCSVSDHTSEERSVFYHARRLLEAVSQGGES